jgi:hypothetical protein
VRWVLKFVVGKSRFKSLMPFNKPRDASFYIKINKNYKGIGQTIGYYTPLKTMYANISILEI